jgi:type IV pilus assembly protein PilP
MRVHQVILAAALLLLSFSVAAMRERQPLEAFQLTELKIVKIYLKGKCAPFVLIRDPNGYVHRVFVGDYIGKNFGLVQKISSTGILIKEMYETQKDEWQDGKVWLGEQPVQ